MAKKVIAQKGFLYHGTSAESADRIRKAGGFRVGNEKGLKDLTGFDVPEDRPISLSLDENTAKLYVGPRPDGGKGDVVAFESKNLNLATEEEAKKLGRYGKDGYEAFVKNLKNAGYDGYHTSSPHDEKVETLVVNKEKLKLANTDQ